MSNHSLPFEKIGPYKVLCEIGRGGTASVYRVQDTHGTCFALKVLHFSEQMDHRWGTRFQREFRLLSCLEHPNLIRVHAYGEDHGRPYFVMDYIDGVNLWTFYRDCLRNLGTKDRLQQLIPLLSQILSALDYIHRRRVIHQDLKPANILLDGSRKIAYLVDFGLARDLRHSVMYTSPGFVGTLGYSAPELVDRGRLDGRTDLYSLGVILYTILADRRPIRVDGRSFDQLIEAIRYEMPLPLSKSVPDLPLPFAEIIHRSMEKDPLARFRNAREFWISLLPFVEEHILDDSPEFGDDSQITMRREKQAVIQKIGLTLDSQFIGRRQELKRFDQHLDVFLKNGSSLLTFYLGSSGVGKSFLLDEFAHRTQRDKLPLSAVEFRENSNPYSSLDYLISTTMSWVPKHLLEDDRIRYLSNFFPYLRRFVNDAEIQIVSHTDSPETISKVLSEWFKDCLRERPQIWLIDDLDKADLLSRRILESLLARFCVDPIADVFLYATLTYEQMSSLEAFQLPEHPMVRHHYLFPFTENEESIFLARFLGRNPSSQEMLHVRRFSSGVPLRTLEILHQSSLLAEQGTENRTNVDNGEFLNSTLVGLKTAIFDKHRVGESLSLLLNLFDGEDDATLPPTSSSLREVDQSTGPSMKQNIGDWGQLFSDDESFEGETEINDSTKRQEIENMIRKQGNASFSSLPSAFRFTEAKETVVEGFDIRETIVDGEEFHKNHSTASPLHLEDDTPKHNHEFEKNPFEKTEFEGDKPFQNYDLGEDAPDDRVMIPLFEQRLNMMDASYQRASMLSALFAQEFTLREIRDVTAFSHEKSLDFVNSLLAFRVFSIQEQHRYGEERYRFLHDVFRKFLLKKFPASDWKASSSQAAFAMERARDLHASEDDAELVALRFVDGGHFQRGVLWYLKALESFLILRRRDRLHFLLTQFEELIDRCPKAEHDELLMSLPHFFEIRDPNIHTRLCRVAFRCLWAGILRRIGSSDIAKVQKREATHLVRDYLASTTNVELTKEYVEMFCEFARIECIEQEIREDIDTLL